MNLDKKADRRIRRTNRSIRDAFVQLIAERGYPSITVQDITELADINRSTFYYHYKDKEDLLEQSIASMLSLAEKDIMRPAVLHDGNSKKKGAEAPLLFYTLMFEHIGKHEQFYRVMLKHVPLFGQQLSEMIQRLYSASISVMQPDENQLLVSSRLLTAYVTGAFTAVILSWLEEELPFSPAHMASQLSQVMMKGPHQAAGLD
ncbi:TetR/AcrR family transcriptional regulator [Paenibacillaceae bacterium]|nr:TetR/AcrR family transcriptional regulator [Paenibacillaceae bacterium]